MARERGLVDAEAYINHMIELVRISGDLSEVPYLQYLLLELYVDFGANELAINIAQALLETPSTIPNLDYHCAERCFYGLGDSLLSLRFVDKGLKCLKMEFDNPSALHEYFNLKFLELDIRQQSGEDQKATDKIIANLVLYARCFAQFANPRLVNTVTLLIEEGKFRANMSEVAFQIWGQTTISATYNLKRHDMSPDALRMIIDKIRYRRKHKAMGADED